jgi:succinate dehydrogenase flavin-adding protein (antitoxin of CptAB toxin-antitoxin module)
MIWQKTLIYLNLFYNMQKKKLLYQSTHRGCKEGDVVLGEFGKANIDKLSQEELDEFENLLQLDDNQILNWVTGKEKAPKEFRQIIIKIAEFNDFY